MKGSQLYVAVLVVVVLTVWVVRMVRVRPLRRAVVGPGSVVLAVLGVASLGGGVRSAIGHGGIQVVPAGLCAFTLVVAALAGWVRAGTVRVWPAGDVVVRQGGWLTILAWVAWVVTHGCLDMAITATDPSGDLAGSTLWSGLAVSLAAQGYQLRRRARTLHPPDRAVPASF